MLNLLAHDSDTPHEEPGTNALVFVAVIFISVAIVGVVGWFLAKYLDDEDS